jgi:hypothetical protein
MTTALYVILGMVIGGALGVLITSLCTVSKPCEQPVAAVDSQLIARAANAIELLLQLCDRQLDEYGLAVTGRIVADLRARLERIGRAQRLITEDDVEAAYAAGFRDACPFPYADDQTVRQAAKLYVARPGIVKPDSDKDLTSEGISCG